MFCPKCKAEYRQGFHTCSDCHIGLVGRLPLELKPVEPRRKTEPQSKPEFIDYTEILRTYNPADIALIKSLLDAENITYYFNNEHFTYAYPWVEPARLMVKKDEAEEAREILKELM